MQAKMPWRLCVGLATCLCFLTVAANGHPPMNWYKDGKLRLSSTMQDNVVLQWSRPCLWGWIDGVPKDQLSRISVMASCQGAEGCHATSRLEATEDGEWRVCLPPQPPGGPTVVAVEAHGEGGKKDVLGRIELQNVLFGDVWIASGQSNIHFTVRAMPVSGLHRERYEGKKGSAREDELVKMILLYG